MKKIIVALEGVLVALKALEAKKTQSTGYNVDDTIFVVSKNKIVEGVIYQKLTNELGNYAPRYEYAAKPVGGGCDIKTQFNYIQHNEIYPTKEAALQSFLE